MFELVSVPPVGFMGLHEITDQLKHAFGTDAYKELIGTNDHLLDQLAYQLRLPD